MQPRYFLAIFPCGIFKVGVFLDNKARPYAILPEGQMGVSFCFAAPYSDEGLVAVETVEISRRQALDVWRLRSPLVPPLVRIAYVAVRLDAAMQAAPLWRAVGDIERAEVVEARIERLKRRLSRLHREAIRFRSSATRGAQPIHFAPNSFSAMAGFLEQGRLTARLGQVRRDRSKCYMLSDDRGSISTARPDLRPGSAPAWRRRS